MLCARGDFWQKRPPKHFEPLYPTYYYNSKVKKTCWIVETDEPGEISARQGRKFRPDVACCLHNSTVSNSENNI